MILGRGLPLGEKGFGFIRGFGDYLSVSVCVWRQSRETTDESEILSYMRYGLIGSVVGKCI